MVNNTTLPPQINLLDISVLPRVDLSQLIALAAIAACLICIYMVFVFGRKVSDTTYARAELVENARRNEYQKLISELKSKAREGPLRPGENDVPDGYGPTSQLWDRNGYADNLARMRSETGFGTTREGTGSGFEEEEADKKKRQEEEAYWKKRQEDRLNNLQDEWKAFIDWEKKEKKIMEEEKRKCDEKASEIAENKIPKSMDISVLGGGFSFLLEFSTVIVIIFSLVILGVLGVLQGENIATILAAIAGYVLGKAGSASEKSEEKSREPTPSGNEQKPA